MAEQRFVIGDIHGCIRSLEALLRLLAPRREDELFFLGDYIDRGPDSKAVLDLLRQLQQDGYTVMTLRGNHEQLLLEAHVSAASFRLWLLNGGAATLRSFGITSPHHLPAEYTNFLAATPLYVSLDVAVLVHAGLNFDLPDPFADTEAMLWDRSLRVDSAKLGGRRLIVGHTPMPLSFIRQSLSQDKVFLDGGCVYGRASGYGYLCALELSSWELIVQEHVDSSVTWL